jgi:hypothetical protein
MKSTIFWNVIPSRPVNDVSDKRTYLRISALLEIVQLHKNRMSVNLHTQNSMQAPPPPNGKLLSQINYAFIYQFTWVATETLILCST